MLPITLSTKASLTITLQYVLFSNTFFISTFKKFSKALVIFPTLYPLYTTITTTVKSADSSPRPTWTTAVRLAYGALAPIGVRFPTS